MRYLNGQIINTKLYYDSSGKR